MADERPTLHWTRPRDGKVFQWRPLKMGVSMDIEASCQGELTYLQKYEGAVRRIVGAGPGGYSLADWREDWEEDDGVAFMRHYSAIEAARAATFAKPETKGLQALEQAAFKLQKAQQEFNVVLEQTLAAARGAGPLVG